ncbi:MAG: phenylacetate--CoA ligase [Betaproteobacteria bacterium]|nr:MAG: phenylacetate--CoA ligase [Betaproteobacteria bacterium]
MGVPTKKSRSVAAKKPNALRKVASKRAAPSYKFDAAAETMPRAEIAKLQLRRLKWSLKNAYDNVPFHRRRMKALGFEPGDLKRLDDIAGLPFTLKTDLRDHYPFGMFARPRTEVVRLHASSGTTGKPTVVGYTAKDISTWADLMARSMACAGGRPGDVIHNAYGYGLFTGGLGAHYGAERLGATVVPMSGGSTERQIVLITDFGARVLCATPSYALAIAEVAEKEGVDLRKSKLEIGIFGAEPWSEGMRREVEARLGLKAVDIYGLSEIMGPGVACECVEAQAGLHGWEDHFLFEVIDIETGKALKEGEAGELVITTLTKEALPMIRYRTRDVTRLSTERCACGRTHVRIKRITGRNDDMLIIRGVNVYPSQIESVLVGLPDVAPHYQLVVERKGTLDHLTIEVEVMPNVVPTAELRRVVAESVRHHVKSIIGVTADVVVKEPGEIPRSMGKAVRVRDLRPKLS